MRGKGVVATAMVSIGAVALSALTRTQVSGITYLFDGDLPAHPYAIPDHAWLLYVVFPVFVASAVTMLLAPGVLTVLATGPERRSWTDAVARGFLVAFAARLLMHSAWKLGGRQFGPTEFWISETALHLAAAGLLIWRSRAHGPGLSLPTDWARLGLLVIVPVVVAVLLLPTIFWQDFTEDGLEALEIGWSLRDFVVPRFPNESGFMGLGIGMLAMAPVVSWFIQLLGPTEAAARLPIVVYLPVLLSVLFALVEFGGRRLRRRDQFTILSVVSAFLAVMAYSATYDAYAADLSAPTAFETLTVTCLAGALLGLWERDRSMFFGFVALGYFARPTALLWIVFLGISCLITLDGDDRRRAVRDLATALGLCVAIAVLYERFFLGWASEGGAANVSGSVFSRYRYLSFLDVRRFLWVMIPGGFLPFAGLVAFRHMDRWSRQLSIVLLLYFINFFFPSFVALHHFAPVMVLPVVVLLRMDTAGSAWMRRVAPWTCAVGFFLAVPHHFHVDQSSRAIGYRTSYEVGEYLGAPLDHKEALTAREAMFELFPATWDVPDPSTERVGAGLPFLYYSARNQVRRTDANYLVLPKDSPAPRGFAFVGERRNAAAFVRDQGEWERDRSTPPPVEFGNPLFVLSPQTLFFFVGAPAGHYDLDLGTLPVIWRLF